MLSSLLLLDYEKATAIAKTVMRDAGCTADANFVDFKKFMTLVVTLVW